MKATSCYLGNLVQTDDELRWQLIWKTTLTLTKTKNSMTIPAHAVHMTILGKNMRMRLATSYLLNQDIITA